MSFRPLHSDPLVSTFDDHANHSLGVMAKTIFDESRRRLIWIVMFLTTGLVAVLASTASGQQFESIPMNKAFENEKTVELCQKTAKNYALSGNGDLRYVNAYFTLYIPAKMTQLPDGVKYISPLVKESTDLLIRAQRSNRSQVAMQLMKFIYDGMKLVAEGNYHPAARINALLVLSRIDTQPADNSNRTPPVPLAQSLPILIAQYQKETNPDGVRAAALQGLHRHVMYGFLTMSQQNKTTVMNAMSQLLTSEPPEGRSDVAHAYLQRFAVDILDILRPNTDKTLGAKLISISIEPKNPDLIALYSASRIATMGAELKGQVTTPEEVLKNWSLRALAAFESEQQRFKAFERPKPASSQPKKPEDLLGKKTETTQRSAMGGEDYEDMMGDMDEDYDMEDMMGGMDEGYDMDDMMDMGGMGMGMMGLVPEAKPQPPEVIASRRKLNHVLQQLHLGVTGAPVAGVPSRNPGGLLASVADDKKPVVEEWIAEMELIVTAINDLQQDDEEKYLETLQTQTAALREFLGVEENLDLPGVPAAMAAKAAAAAAPPVDELLGAAAADAAAAPLDELAAPAVDELAAPAVDELAP